MYGALVLRNLRSISLLASTIRTGSKPKEFYEQHSRSLCVVPTVSAVEWPDLSDIIASCPALVSLAIWDYLSQEEVLTIWLCSLRPGHFSRLCRLSLWLPYDGPFVKALVHHAPCITHLDFIVPYHGPLEQLGDLFKSLPRLTHPMFMSFRNPEQTISFLRSHLPLSIRVCIVYCDRPLLTQISEEWVRQYIDDPSPIVLGNLASSAPEDSYDLLAKFSQCLLVDVCTTATFVKNWGCQERANNVWGQAEEVLALKRSTALAD